MSYLIVYDIQKLDNAMRLRANRHLRKLGAIRLQHSVWELDKFAPLQGLAVSIKSAGGKALILRKQVAYE